MSLLQICPLLFRPRLAGLQQWFSYSVPAHLLQQLIDADVQSIKQVFGLHYRWRTAHCEGAQYSHQRRRGGCLLQLNYLAVARCWLVIAVVHLQGHEFRGQIVEEPQRAGFVVKPVGNAAAGQILVRTVKFAQETRQLYAQHIQVAAIAQSLLRFGQDMDLMGQIEQDGAVAVTSDPSANNLGTCLVPAKDGPVINGQVVKWDVLLPTHPSSRKDSSKALSILWMGSSVDNLTW